jgi:hypothetical protein
MFVSIVRHGSVASHCIVIPAEDQAKVVRCDAYAACH